jgi:hypothetical protein
MVACTLWDKTENLHVSYGKREPAYIQWDKTKNLASMYILWERRVNLHSSYRTKEKT